MKIKTANGELELPKDFSMKIEKTNPILSDKGDVSVPATLPASTHNFEVLGHRERIDRSTRYTNKFDAIMSVGPITKRGHLIVDTIQIHNGIDAVFAMDNSDLYVQYKEKTIKEIFNSANSGAGYIVTLGNTPNNAMMALQAVYETGNTNGDYMIFPVAVSPYESGDKTYYQYNNEIDQNNNLVWGERTVHEGDKLVTVPYGYGISPFIRLYKMINIMFGILGYTVTSNCFANNDCKNLVLVNNCADTICKDIVHLNYADMVPSCTLSEFLEWLNNKFHAQAFINSDSRTVKIVKMEDILSNTADLDLTNNIEDDLAVQLSPTKRIILQPKVTLDGTEAASDDIDELLAKYGGYYVAVTEAEYASLLIGTPLNNHAYDCLILRKSTGDFYALFRDINDSNYKQSPVHLGTNIMKYDRKNSDEEEEFSVEDVIPKMLTNGASTVPFIGERIHFHTSYNAETKDKQEIILVRGILTPDMPAQYGYKTTGTTQDYYPGQEYNGVYASVNIPFGLMPHQLYSYFWEHYNNLLLNHATHVKARLRLEEDKFLTYDMSRLKLCRGQKLLPVSAAANIGVKMEAVDAEFIIAKSFTDEVTDTAVTPTAQSPLKWELTDDIETAQEYYNNHVAYDYWKNGVHYYTSFISESSSATYIDDLGLYWMGVPAAINDNKYVTRKIRYVIHYWKHAGDITSTDTTTAEVDATVTFTAVTNS